MLQNAVALKVWFVCNSKAAHLYISKNLISAGAFQRAIQCIFIGFESQSRYACQNWHQIFVLVMRTRKKTSNRTKWILKYVKKSETRQLWVTLSVLDMSWYCQCNFTPCTRYTSVKWSTFIVECEICSFFVYKPWFFLIICKYF